MKPTGLALSMVFLILLSGCGEHKSEAKLIETTKTETVKAAAATYQVKEGAMQNAQKSSSTVSDTVNTSKAGVPDKTEEK